MIDLSSADSLIAEAEQHFGRAGAIRASLVRDREAIKARIATIDQFILALDETPTEPPHAR